MSDTGLKSTGFLPLHLYELGWRSVDTIGPASGVEPEVTMSQPDGQLRREPGVDTSKNKQTPQK